MRNTVIILIAAVLIGGLMAARYEVSSTLVRMGLAAASGVVLAGALIVLRARSRQA